MESISTRVHNWLRDKIVEFGKAHREGPSEALRRVAEEWWATQEFPAIEFREGVTGRRAGLRSGPDVWEVIMVWRDYDPDRERFYEHFGEYVPREDLDQALAYFGRFPDEIESRIAENERMAARLEARAGLR